MLDDSWFSGWLVDCLAGLAFWLLGCLASLAFALDRFSAFCFAFIFFSVTYLIVSWADIDASLVLIVSFSLILACCISCSLAWVSSSNWFLSSSFAFRRSFCLCFFCSRVLFASSLIFFFSHMFCVFF